MKWKMYLKESSMQHGMTAAETDREALRRAFDELFQKHMAFLRGHSTTLDEIKQHSPETAEELVSLSKAMDTAWYWEDLPTFKEIMSKLEMRYLKAHHEITGRRK